MAAGRPPPDSNVGRRGGYLIGERTLESRRSHLIGVTKADCRTSRCATILAMAAAFLSVRRPKHLRRVGHPTSVDHQGGRQHAGPITHGATTPRFQCSCPNRGSTGQTRTPRGDLALAMGLAPAEPTASVQRRGVSNHSMAPNPARSPCESGTGMAGWHHNTRISQRAWARLAGAKNQNAYGTQRHTPFTLRAPLEPSQRTPTSFSAVTQAQAGTRPAVATQRITEKYRTRPAQRARSDLLTSARLATATPTAPYICQAEKRRKPRNSGRCRPMAGTRHRAGAMISAEIHPTRTTPRCHG